MKRSGFARKPDSPFSSFANAKTALRRTEMKKRARKKPTVAEGSKYLEACRGECCYLNVLDVCSHNDETVVPCHSNQSVHGKGLGIKAKHEFTVPGCAACHAWLDQGRAERWLKVVYWNNAFEEWAPIRARKLGIETMEFDA